MVTHFLILTGTSRQILLVAVRRLWDGAYYHQNQQRWHPGVRPRMSHQQVMIQFAPGGYSLVLPSLADPHDYCVEVFDAHPRQLIVSQLLDARYHFLERPESPLAQGRTVRPNYCHEDFVVGIRTGRFLEL